MASQPVEEEEGEVQVAAVLALEAASPLEECVCRLTLAVQAQEQQGAWAHPSVDTGVQGGL